MQRQLSWLEALDTEERDEESRVEAGATEGPLENPVDDPAVIVLTYTGTKRASTAALLQTASFVFDELLASDGGRTGAVAALRFLEKALEALERTAAIDEAIASGRW